MGEYSSLDIRQYKNQKGEIAEKVIATLLFIHILKNEKSVKLGNQKNKDNIEVDIDDNFNRLSVNTSIITDILLWGNKSQLGIEVKSHEKNPFNKNNTIKELEKFLDITQKTNAGIVAIWLNEDRSKNDWTPKEGTKIYEFLERNTRSFISLLNYLEDCKEILYEFEKYEEYLEIVNNFTELLMRKYNNLLKDENNKTKLVNWMDNSEMEEIINFFNKHSLFINPTKAVYIHNDINYKKMGSYKKELKSKIQEIVDEKSSRIITNKFFEKLYWINQFGDEDFEEELKAYITSILDTCESDEWIKNTKIEQILNILTKDLKRIG